MPNACKKVMAFTPVTTVKILFGGFAGGGRWRGSQAWKEKMKQRWDKMTPEEREKFKTEWRNRCGGRWGRTEDPENPDTPSAH